MLSAALDRHLRTSDIRHTITSIGIPILLPDGRTILRGPFFKLPAYNKKRHTIPIDEAAIDRFAKKGWVDLRASHMAFWLDAARRMRKTVHRRGAKWSSERLDLGSYLSEDLRIGEVVAWIFNNLLDPPGYRIK